MDRQSIKEFMYGGLTELIKNPNYYYHSGAGMTYSHLTDRGEQAIVEYMNMVSWKMLEAEEADLNKRAKNLVIQGLKGEKV